MPLVSLTTACAPWYPLPELVGRLQTAGYQAIEVGLTERRHDADQAPDFWGNNPAVLDWDHALEEAAALRPLLDRHRLPCCCIASYVETDDIDRIARAIEVARILGAEFIRVRVPWYRSGDCYRELLERARATYRDLAQLSRETGVDSLIEIHDNSICPSASAAMRVLEGLDPSLVGVIFDPGNYAREGMEAIPMVIDLLGPFLRHIHVKNGSLAMAETSNAKGLRMQGPQGRLRDGLIDWSLVFRELAARGWEGACSIENFEPSSRPETRLAADASWLRETIDAAYAG